jgi:hypothetical protein
MTVQGNGHHAERRDVRSMNIYSMLSLILKNDVLNLLKMA